jgi:inner membrane protein
MCSVLTHPVVPIALAAILPHDTRSPTLVLVGAACAVIPDLDVIGIKFGVGSHPLLGHRGLTHSIVFAAVLGVLLTYTLFRNSLTPSWVVFLFVFFSTLSHPLLDMLTNGGRGVALFAPFSNTRYFFPWRPIEVSPIGVRRFFTWRGVQIMCSELQWVWLPAAGVSILGMIVRRYG